MPQQGRQTAKAKNCQIVIHFSQIIIHFTNPGLKPNKTVNSAYIYRQKAESGIHNSYHQKPKPKPKEARDIPKQKQKQNQKQKKGKAN